MAAIFFATRVLITIDSTLYCEDARKSLPTGPNRGSSVLAMHLRAENVNISVPYIETSHTTINMSLPSNRPFKSSESAPNDAFSKLQGHGLTNRQASLFSCYTLILVLFPIITFKLAQEKLILVFSCPFKMRCFQGFPQILAGFTPRMRCFRYVCMLMP
jgi:hypothetical protein